MLCKEKGERLILVQEGYTISWVWSEKFHFTPENQLRCSLFSF